MNKENKDGKTNSPKFTMPKEIMEDAFPGIKFDDDKTSEDGQNAWPEVPEVKYLDVEDVTILEDVYMNEHIGTSSAMCIHKYPNEEAILILSGDGIFSSNKKRPVRITLSVSLSSLENLRWISNSELLLVYNDGQRCSSQAVVFNVSKGVMEKSSTFRAEVIETKDSGAAVIVTDSSGSMKIYPVTSPVETTEEDEYW